MMYTKDVREELVQWEAIDCDRYRDGNNGILQWGRENWLDSDSKDKW